MLNRYISKAVKGPQSMPLACPSTPFALPTLGAFEPMLGLTWSPVGQPRWYTLIWYNVNMGLKSVSSSNPKYNVSITHQARPDEARSPSNPHRSLDSGHSL